MDLPWGGGEVEVVFDPSITDAPKELTIDDTHVWWLVATGDEGVGIWRAPK